ncbi:MAG: Zn-ribbon domain-containing OB-fold protein [Alphaproteobacteria bacterium]|jgi:hypothetical protein|nr:Zn-ribbon domain-containing OB-fold protein [Alphaproteobacteria bacterium]MDP6565209.1 Zn-ribbon domain-containing OB-fold protein [Alphaproteobacteria bacterium]MDP6815474.1 Zn-ribbon domain-containing OB-fold protein [Alphaproteobacteria bacterium]
MTRIERSYPEPSINLETERYWQAAKDGVLLLKKCNDCGKTHFYPRAICPHCLGGDTEWYEASGRGRIYTYSVMRRAATPYAIAYVTLDEGVTMMTNIVECDLDGIEIGQEVEVTFRATEGDQALPVFRPVSS